MGRQRQAHSLTRAKIRELLYPSAIQRQLERPHYRPNNCNFRIRKHTEIMVRPRRVISSFWLIGLFWVWFATAQDVTHDNSTGLEVVRMGHINDKSGHITLFRIYKAPDGTKGQVHYTDFDSLEAAEQQIEKWLKATRTVTSREHNQSKGGQLISDRILAVADLPKSHKKEFVIIRRYDLKCYFIESVSLQVALRVEGLIEH